MPAIIWCARFGYHVHGTPTEATNHIEETAKNTDDRFVIFSRYSERDTRPAVYALAIDHISAITDAA